MTIAHIPTAAGLQQQRHSRLYWALADALVLAMRRIRQMPRIPDEIVFATIQPVMFVLLFRFVFGSIPTPPGISYVNYLMAGIFIQTIIFGATTTGVGLAQDMERGLIDRFRSLPMAKSAVLTGRTLADLTRNFVVVLVMLAVGLLVDFRPQGSPLGWLGAFGIILLVSFAFSWVSATMGLLVHSVEAAQSVGFIWLFPLTFASSAFVQVKTISPDWLQWFAAHQPVSIFINAVREWILGRPVGSDGWLSLAWCLAILAVFIPLSVWLYGRRVGR